MSFFKSSITKNDTSLQLPTFRHEVVLSLYYRVQKKMVNHYGRPCILIIIGYRVFLCLIQNHVAPRCQKNMPKTSSFRNHYSISRGQCCCFWQKLVASILHQHPQRLLVGNNEPYDENEYIVYEWEWKYNADRKNSSKETDNSQ